MNKETMPKSKVSEKGSHAQAKPADDKKKKDNKRKIAALAVVCIGFIVLIIFVVVSVNNTSPLDYITNYEVAVEPQNDGALNITYHLKWNVLNDSREGPLEWVKIGMANPNYTILGTGGAIASEHIDASESQSGVYAMFDLDRAYHKGETADFWFTVRQEKMISRIGSSGVYSKDSTDDTNADSDGDNELVYDFTPGWFDGITVESYLFTWKKSSRITSYNADREDDDRLIWEGKLLPGEMRDMAVHYSPDAFDNPMNQLGTGSNDFYDGSYDDYQSDDQSGELFIAFFIIVITVIIAWNVYRPNTGYKGGRGFFWHGGGYHGGSGCACACAGCACACACACAGGGRAGCSAKDFYSHSEEDFSPKGKWDLESVCKAVGDRLGKDSK